jgi:hypothetical protein
MVTETSQQARTTVTPGALSYWGTTRQSTPCVRLGPTRQNPVNVKYASNQVNKRG